MPTRPAHLSLALAGALLASCACGPSKPAVASDSALFAFAEARRVERLWAFAEGPTWLAGRGLLFTDVVGNRLLLEGEDEGGFEVLTQPSGRATGTSLDADGTLVVCESNLRGGGGRALSRWTLEPVARTVIVDRFEGERFNSPNDLTIDSAGRIYFSDPRYHEDADAELEVEGVYRVDGDGGGLVRVLGPGQVARPNGVELSLDERTLYVTDTMIGGPALLYAFALDEAGLPTGERETLYDFGSGRGGDGMCLDAKGNLYVAASGHRPPGLERDLAAGLYAFSAAGELLEAYPIDDRVVTNCTFGGAAGTTIYVTSSRALWAVEARNAGAARGARP